MYKRRLLVDIRRKGREIRFWPAFARRYLKKETLQVNLADFFLLRLPAWLYFQDISCCRQNCNLFDVYGYDSGNFN